MMKTTYDIAIIGSGIACSLLLCRLAERLKKSPRRSEMLRIAVIEREGQLWKGVPYGRRSTMGSLTFQKLDEFLNEPERSDFIEWIAANQEGWLESLRDCGGPGAARWILDNQSLMDQGRWGDLYLPRFLFGSYLTARTVSAVQQLSQANLAAVTPIHGEAIEVSRTPSGMHEVMVAKDGVRCFLVSSARVVLAIGSPPQKCIYRNPDEAEARHTYIGNIYSPSEDATIQTLQQRLSTLSDKSAANVLILGSNASALEMLYLIYYRPEISSLIRSIVVLSRSGKLAYKIEDQTLNFELVAFESLVPGECSAANLIEAIRSDIGHATELGVNIADLRDLVGAAVSRLMTNLHVDEQKKFVCEYGAAYSRMMRRAGRDIRKAADELTKLGLLKTVRGELHHLTMLPASDGQVNAHYSCQEYLAEMTYPMAFSITLNCGGFEELNVCSSPLVNSLIANGLCTVNSTNRGFLLDEHLQASTNLYVIGPLVGGNFNERVRFWHVESASRIASLARSLAESLYDSLTRPEAFALNHPSSHKRALTPLHGTA